MKSVIIRTPTLKDENAFLAMVHTSDSLHHPWVKPPDEHDAFVEYIQRTQQDNQKSFLVCASQGDIIGVFNISEIVRGCFQSAYLGFYAAIKQAGKGLMSQGLRLVLKEAFTNMELHRLEANIQPENTASLNFVKKNGFRKEGLSKRYLKINHEWRDHERWAITVEDWL